jgi:hypothetical protein
MMARGFKPVGWVAGVAAAALGCYMLSLNVASERADLARIERGIVMAKQDIRTLQTELGTRGRLQQLESWNANVLALSAPTSAQFIDSELTLARFDRRDETIEERSQVHMAAAPNEKTAPAQSAIQAPVRYAAAPAAKPAPSLVHQASLSVSEPKPAPAAKKIEPVKLASAEPKKPEPKAEIKKTELKKPELQASAKKAEPKKVADTKKLAETKKAPAAAKLAKKGRAEAKSGKSGSAGGQ